MHYFEKEDNESFDDSKDLNFVDIFDINFDRYNLIKVSGTKNKSRSSFC